ncbi:MAG TPA: ParA family protein, partial [Bacillota bacterium]|nr:ParA family protein [Bacillota bacterium]
RVYKTIIPRNVRLSEAPSHGAHIFDYDPRSKGAETYLALAQEVMDS